MKKCSLFLPLTLAFIAILLSSQLRSQNIESIVDSIKSFNIKESVKVNGGVHLSNTIYWADGLNPRRDLFQWLASANLSFTAGGFTLPFSVTFSEGNKEFNLPSFLFAGLSPTYKWATVHAGDRVMNFSDYTMVNHNFFGGGFELKPGNIRVGGMYGRMKRAVAEDLVNLQAIDPTYRRWGTGGYIGYDMGEHAIQLNVFKAWDDENSIPENPQRLEVLPADNAVMSLTGRTRLLKKISLSGEYARSAHNHDKRSPESNKSEVNVFHQMFGLFKPTTSAVYASAFKINSSLNIKKSNVGLGYERIAPGFKTLGALYFDNDVERYTSNLSTRFLKDKISFSATVGLERSDLDKIQNTAHVRIIGSSNINYRHSNRLNFDARYSNFRNTTKLKSFRDPFNPIDSIFLAQVSQSFNLSSTYTFFPGAEHKRSSLTGLLTFQNAKSIENDEVDIDPTRFYNGNLIYTYGLTDIGLSTSVALSLTSGEVNSITHLSLSPNVSIQKTFLEDKKVRTRLSFAYSKVYADSNPTSQVFNTGLSASYNFLKGHQVGWRNSYVWRSAISNSGLNNTNEFTGTINYSYQF